MKTMVTATEIQAYWDEYALYSQIRGAEWGSRDFFQRIKDDHDKAYGYSNEILNIPSHKGKSILEICCGIGLDTLELAKYGANITFMSPSPKLIELTEKYFTYHGLDANLDIGNAEELPYPANILDVVIARGILMYMPNPRRVLDEIYRVLKPEGEIYAHMHNKYSWYVFLAKLSGSNLVHEKKDPPIHWHNSIRETRMMFKKFSSVKISMGRFPLQRTKRIGMFARLYNDGLIPFTKIIPKRILRPFGYYIIIKATK
jgi:2-polyprenyl-3-methyl-5-hydroxy-6-metoxy-1,4-benzoquinol methylase